MIPLIAIGPVEEPGLVAAVEAGGGRIAPAEQADGVVWINPRDPAGLKAMLETSPARWVQLPFAGIESFVAAGVIDPQLTWTCAKGIYGHACAEHALALLLVGARRLAHHARARRWEEPGLGSPERRLKGATVVIAGLGGIGRELATMLAHLGADVVGTNRSGRAVPDVEVVPSTELDRVLPGADHVAVCAALTPETRGMFGAPQFDAMKPTAWIVNVARGGLIDTAGLVAALESGAIAGAALDVTDPEPLPEGHPLWTMDNVLITPHIANTWDMAVPELQDLVRRNVGRFAAGAELEGLVDPAAGY